MSKTFRSCQNYVKLVFQGGDHSKKVVHPRLSKIKHDEAMFLRCFFLVLNHPASLGMLRISTVYSLFWGMNILLQHIL